MRSAAGGAVSTEGVDGAGAGTGACVTVSDSAASAGDSRTGWLTSDGATGVVGDAALATGTEASPMATPPSPGSVPQCKQAKPAGRSALQLAQVCGSPRLSTP